MISFLDCTLRDGGYYNAWDFEPDLIADYLKAISALPVDVVEIGFRSMPGNSGKFRGGCAYCTDAFIRTLDIPDRLRIAVMVNGADLTSYPDGIVQAVDRLFGPAEASPVELVRIAVHVHKVEETLPAITRLKELGYKTTFQLMQIAGLSRDEVLLLAKACSEFPLDVLYFADSLGSMVPDDINQTVEALRTYWQGDLGFHAHNNMQGGVANCIRAVEQGVTWIDGTVMGMGRGPGNAPTEYLAIEMETRWGKKMHHTPLLDLISKYFKPMQQEYGWGPNPYYYMAGKYGIHPTYVQTMLSDSRYENDEILTVLDEIKKVGGKNYSPDSLELARKFFIKTPRGLWNPEELIRDKTLLIIGSGPNINKYSLALKNYIENKKPVVIALNKQSPVNQNLIDARAACRPLRLLADAEDHNNFEQPLICPASMLPLEISKIFVNKEIYDYGIVIEENTFEIHNDHCVLPYSLVIAYVLAVGIRGKAKKILLAGFEGYPPGDTRMLEMGKIFSLYYKNAHAIDLFAVTPSRYNVHQESIFNPLL